MSTNRVFDAVRVRDQLGRPDDKALFGPYRLQERVRLTETPTIALQRNVENDTRWDVSKWDEDTWGDVHENSFEIVRVTNPNNNFVWVPYFDDTDSGDYPLTRSLIGDNTTASVNHSTGEVTFSAEQVLEIESAFKDTSGSQVVSSCTVQVFGVGDFAVAVSADGGSSWSPELETEAYEFSDETYGSGLLSGYSTSALDFPATRGSDLRIRVTKSGASTGKVTLLRCAYTI